ncbi:MAG: YdcF family protein [Shewanella sp.]
MPIPFILLLLLISFFVWRRRSVAKYLVSCAFILLLFLSSQLSVNTLVRPLESVYPINSTPITGACFVMVLGSGHADIAGATAVQSLSSVALARLTEGVRQLKLGQECMLIVSGWGGELTQFSHAEMMAKAAVELGVDSRRIVQFPLARDTIEEAQYAKWELGEEPFRLVTSASHMQRAMTIFAAQGVRPDAAPTDFIGREGFWWVLTADNLVDSQRAIHEYIGRLWLWLKALI